VRTGADGVTRLSLGGSTIAEGASASSPPRVVDSVSVDLAYAAHKSYAGLSDHPFAGCFVCGTTRASGDALLLRPGRIDGGRTACVWTPHPGLADDTGAVGAPFVWAALDCPGGWSADLEGRPMVLGRMSACVEAVPEVGEPCVVMGERLTGDGRKTFTAATLYDSDGRVLACAEHTWIAVDPDRFRDGGAAAHQSSAT
jgi:hypothetical protein